MERIERYKSPQRRFPLLLHLLNFNVKSRLQGSTMRNIYHELYFYFYLVLAISTDPPPDLTYTLFRLLLPTSPFRRHPRLRATL